MSLAFGFGLITCQRYPGDPRSDQDLYAQALTLAEDAEALGFDSVWAISVHLPVFAWEEDGGWELIRPYHRYVAWKYDDMDQARARGGPPAPPPAVSAAGEAELRGAILLGTPAEVAERIDAYRRAAGGDLHFIARLYFPGRSWPVQRQAVRVFAEQVIPRARALAGEAAHA